MTVQLPLFNSGTRAFSPRLDRVRRDRARVRRLARRLGIIAFEVPDENDDGRAWCASFLMDQPAFDFPEPEAHGRTRLQALRRLVRRFRHRRACA